MKQIQNFIQNAVNVKVDIFQKLVLNKKLIIHVFVKYSS